MGLVFIGSKPYLYRSVRVGGKVQTKYVASGEKAVAKASLDRKFREEEALFRAVRRRALERERTRERSDSVARKAILQTILADEREKSRRLAARGQDVLNEIKMIEGYAMRAAGYRLHRRSWRKGRRQMTEAFDSSPETVLEEPAADITQGRGEASMGSPHDTPPNRLTGLAIVGSTSGTGGLGVHEEDPQASKEQAANRLSRARELAKGGDHEVAERLRLAIRENPGAVTPNMLSALGGDPASKVEASLVREATGDDSLAAVALQEKMKRMKAELAPPGSSVVEVLLADRVALTWLDAHNADFVAIHAGRFPPSSTSRGVVAEMEKRRNAAQRRYLAALRSLAVVKTKAAPILAMAIKDSQLSIAGVDLANFASAFSASPQHSSPAIIEDGRD